MLVSSTTKENGSSSTTIAPMGSYSSRFSTSSPPLRLPGVRKIIYIYDSRNHPIYRVYLNSERIPKQEPQTLSSGDIIIFGVNMSSSEFVYKYEVESLASKDEIERIRAEKEKLVQEEVERIRKEKEKEKEQQIAGLKRKFQHEDTEYKKRLKKLETERCQERLAEQRRYQKAQEEITRIREEAKAKEEQIAKEKRIVEEKQRKATEEKEKELSEKLQKSLEELNKKREQERQQQDAILRIREEEALKLKKEIEALNSKVKDGTKAKQELEKMRQHLDESMEEELECCICCSMFMKACTLPCSHSFCEDCITEYLNRRDECPHCRKKVSLPIIPSVTLNNMVERVIQSRSIEEQEKRKQALEQRNNKGQMQAAHFEKLRKTIETAKKNGHRFFNIKNNWSKTEKGTFKEGMTSLKYPKARKLYASTVSLSEDGVAKMNQKHLTQAIKNLGLKNMKGDSIIEQRRKLMLFVLYGTTALLA
mmetsp:Transcript_44192/g.73642  ORF Transcript_44192/g.73642 Transcript_44192/m.73642 type:complete len:479 (-) Transcript_44192:194-1630(-)